MDRIPFKTCPTLVTRGHSVLAVAFTLSSTTKLQSYSIVTLWQGIKQVGGYRVTYNSKLPSSVMSHHPHLVVSLPTFATPIFWVLWSRGHISLVYSKTTLAYLFHYVVCSQP